MKYEGKIYGKVAGKYIELQTEKAERQKTILQILEYQRQKFPFREEEKSENRYLYYHLSSFLNDFLKIH